MQIELRADRSLKTVLPSNLLKEMEKRELIVVNEKHTISFVGAIIYDNCINVFLPRSCNISLIDDHYKYAALTMNVVEKFGRTSRTKLNNIDKGNAIAGELNLTLIKSILTDFQENGIYKRRYNETHLNSGRPDWKKTVNRFLPFFTKKGAPVYLDYFSRKQHYNSDNIVSKIHSEIIAYLDCHFAWWITGSHKQRIAPELSYSQNLHRDTLKDISILQQELSSVYSDSDIRLICNLIDFLKQTEGNENSFIITGLRDFHYAWEAMLCEISEGLLDLNKLLPKPVYINSKGDSSVASGMRTDLIIENGEKTKIAIVDAKYYSAKTLESSPHWADIVKQLFYEKSVKIIKPDHEVINCFVFPGGKSYFERVELRGQVNGDNVEALFNPIKCIYLPPLEVMQNYINATKILSYASFEK